MKGLRGFVVALVLVILGLLLFVYSGSYDVAASSSPGKAEEWLLESIRESGISSRAKGIKAPALGSPEQVQQGFELYRAHCVTCHGAPGAPPEELAMGLHPVPPGLSFPKVQKRPDAELFWIAKHGLKFTGMPGFGMMRSDEELWAVVAFVRKLPNLSPDDYQRMAEAGESESSTGEI
ncbi:MAG TPA: cytochrome c [Thermoanaerobaculia bacterium]|nr:cytochrome c [Thermoanaerobaculia bacterium]